MFNSGRAFEGLSYPDPRQLGSTYLAVQIGDTRFKHAVQRR